MPHAAVGPDVRAEPPRRGGALEHGGELRPADAGHHPGGAHRAGPDADLDDVAPGARPGRATPSAVTTLPAASGQPQVRASGTAASALEHLVLVPVRGVDHQHVDPASASSSAALAATSPLMPTAAAIRSRPAASTAGRVDASPAARRCGSARRPAGRRLGHHRGQPAAAVAASSSNACRRVGALHRSGDEVGDIDVAHLGEPVHAAAVRLGDHPDRAGRRRRPPPPRRAAACGSGAGRRRPVSSGRSVTGVSKTRSRLLTQATSRPPRRVGMSCGSTTMPPRRATVSAIRRPATAVMLATTTGMVVPVPSSVRQVDVEPGRHRRRARDHEDVAVGQVVTGLALGESHAASSRTGGTAARGARIRR